MVIYSKQLDEN